MSERGRDRCYRNDLEVLDDFDDDGESPAKRKSSSSKPRFDFFMDNF